MLRCVCAYVFVAFAAAGVVVAGGGRGRGRDFGANAPAERGPAPTLTAPSSPATRPDEDGFIRRWMLLEPIPALGVSQTLFRATIGKEYFPNQLTVLPKDHDKVTVDGTDLLWHAYDTSLYNFNLYHFSFALNKPTSGVFWWAVTVVNLPEDWTDVRLAIGSNDASVWWVNGEEVIGIYGNRMDVPDDGVSKKLSLKKGPNVIRAAISNEMGPSDFCARFLDKDDLPLTNFTVSLSKDATKGAQ